jgi:hypothetical protein
MFTAALFGSLWGVGANVGLIFTGLVFVLVTLIVGIVGIWKVFAKAGQPGWASIIPLYNTWVLAEIIGKPGWWGLYPLLSWIPFIGWFGAIAISIYMALEVAKVFGKSGAFGFFGLWLFSFVGYLILGFGDAQYQGSGAGPVDPAAGGNPPANPRPTAPTATPPVPPAGPVPQ